MSQTSDPQVNGSSVPVQGAVGQSAPQRTPVVQPEYGQIKVPEYGQMAAAYPGYNPYIYGEPEHSTNDDASKGADQAAHRGLRNTTVSNAKHSGQASREDSGQEQKSTRSPIAARLPFDPDNPQENPMYGQWDPTAIIAFVSALFGIPVLPIILGAFAAYRDKILHMRGRGLAIAAIIISLLMSALAMYFVLSGTDPMTWVMDLYGVDPSQLLNGSGDSTSV